MLDRILRPGWLGRTVPTTISNSTRLLGRYHGMCISPGRSTEVQVTSFDRYYTWSPNSIDTALEYVPMLWGERQIGQWTSTINQTILTRKATHALAFNEYASSFISPVACLTIDCIGRSSLASLTCPHSKVRNSGRLTCSRSRRRVSGWVLLHLRMHQLERPGCRISLPHVAGIVPSTSLLCTGTGLIRRSSSITCKTSMTHSNVRSGSLSGHVRSVHRLDLH